MNEYVFLLRGPSGVARVKVQGTFLVLGRTSTIPLLRADRTISREHAVLVAAPEGIRLKDLGSGNGVLVDGKRMPTYAEVTLTAGTRVSFGNTELLLLTQREASKRLDQAVDEVLVDEEGTTSVTRAARRGSKPVADPEAADEEELAAEDVDPLDEPAEVEFDDDETPAEALEGEETHEDLVDDPVEEVADSGSPDAWIEDALVEPAEEESIPKPGKVTELDAELTELELPSHVELSLSEEVSRDSPTRIEIENVLERGLEETANPEAASWNQVEQELADLERREPNLE